MGIEPAIFRLVAQCLNRYATATTRAYESQLKWQVNNMEMGEMLLRLDVHQLNSPWQRTLRNPHTFLSFLGFCRTLLHKGGGELRWIKIN
jgi:hypothetical protein